MTEENIAVETKRIYIILDGTFALKGGKPASYNMDREFFSRYLNVFEEVVVVARLFQKEEPSAGPIEGPNISFMALPNYKGAFQTLMAIPQLIWIFLQISRDKEGTVMVRLPSSAGNFMGHIMCLLRKPFGLELLGDPAHAYSKESLRHPLGRLFQWLFTASSKYLCKRAKTASYVTRETLQRDYPPGKNASSFHYTSLDLPQSGFVEHARSKEDFSSTKPCLVQVAMMPTWYKGHDVSLATMAYLKKRGLNVHLRLVGAGRLRPKLEAMVAELGIEKLVTFVGQVKSGKGVWKELDKADMLILPSRQEGLPRVVIEAMARGLPCLANNIGGTAEILDSGQMVEDLTPEVVGAKIENNLADISLLVEQSARNLSIAKEYSQELVQIRRDDCYAKLKQASK